MTNLITVETVGELDEILSDNPAVLVEFGADWCQPCKRFLPHFIKFADKRPDVTCVKVDIETDDNFIKTYKIQSVPQVMLFVGNDYVTHIEARTVLALEQELDGYLET